MIPNDIRTIIIQLSRKSEKKEINWKQSSSIDPQIDEDADDFVVSFPHSSINIYQFVFEKSFGIENNVIRLNFLNERGKVVDYVELSEHDEDYTLLEKLLKLAKRNTLNRDEVMDDIRNELNQDNKPGPEKEPPTKIMFS